MVSDVIEQWMGVKEHTSFLLLFQRRTSCCRNGSQEALHWQEAWALDRGMTPRVLFLISPRRWLRIWQGYYQGMGGYSLSPVHRSTLARTLNVDTFCGIFWTHSGLIPFWQEDDSADGKWWLIMMDSRCLANLFSSSAIFLTHLRESLICATKQNIYNERILVGELFDTADTGPFSFVNLMLWVSVLSVWCRWSMKWGSHKIQRASYIFQFGVD